MPEKIKVFISNAQEDRETAKQLYDDLKKAEVIPWMEEEDLLPGSNREFKIREEIQSSRFFLALLSSRSVTKRGTVQKKLKNALDILKEFPEDDIFVIPVRIEDCVLPQNLSDIHSADLFPSYDVGLRKILKTIENELASRQTAVSFSSTNFNDRETSEGAFKVFAGSSKNQGFLPLEDRLKSIESNRNPYEDGTQLQANSPLFFGREQVMHEILGAFRKPGKPGCVSLLGESRIGKSSLLNQVCQALRKEDCLVTIYADAQNWGRIKPQNFYSDIWRSLCGELKIPQRSDVNTFESFRDFIRELAKNFRFVLIMDEFGEMAANKYLGKTFFGNLRHLGSRDEYAGSFSF